MGVVSDRTFGVELEFNGTGGTEDTKELLRKNGFTRWSDTYIHHDGSGIEIPSPVLRGKDGFTELKEVLQLLVENGGQCNTADGLHVHHGANEFRHSKENTLRLLESWAANQEHIFAMVDEYRTEGEGRHWCKPWLASDIEHYKGLTQVPGWDRYYSLNITPLRRSPATIEIRLHEGTLEYEKIEAWIKFGQYFLGSCLERKKPIVCAPDPDKLLNRIKAPKNTAEVLAKLAKAKKFKIKDIEGLDYDYEDDW